MRFDVRKFHQFCTFLQVDTKEQGRIRLGNHLLGTQRYLINEIANGLEEDIHHFVVLKGRQASITTIGIAFDLYWLFKHSGLQGTLVCDSDENKVNFRSMIELYMKSLPPQWKVPEKTHNRTLLQLKNRSKFFYQVAGTRGNPYLGQGKGITFCHATEVGSYGSDEGVMSLMASLAETNPLRFYLFESTAHGFNYFHEMWEMAKRARNQRAVFIGWWRNELFAEKLDSANYRVYWDGKLTAEEKEWVKEVRKLYDIEINSRQIAWWRRKAAEEFPDEEIQFQNYPPTENYAFVATGSLFFSTSTLTDAMKKAKRTPGENFRFTFGPVFADTTLKQTTLRLCTLTVWERPVDDAFYAIGADPAYGSSDWADRFAIQVFRCYADGMEQVAEFATADMNTYEFAWVLCYLGGLYRNSKLNLEVNGPGGAVLNEIKNLKRQASSLPPPANDERGKRGESLFSVLSHMSFYLWRRPDATTGPTGAIGWITNESNKSFMLNCMRDRFTRGQLLIRSEALLNEMRKIESVEGSIAAEGRNKDDRVMAAGLAVAAYEQTLLPRLLALNLTRAEYAKRHAEQPNPTQDAVNRNITDYLTRIGFKVAGGGQ